MCSSQCNLTVVAVAVSVLMLWLCECWCSGCVSVQWVRNIKVDWFEFVILNSVQLTPTAAQHLTHVHESCYTSEYESWMIWQSKTETTHANGGSVCDTCAWVMARIATSNVRHVRIKVEWFGKHKRGPSTQYVTHVDDPCHTWQWVMSHIWIWKLTKTGPNTCQRLLSKRAWHYWRVHRYGNLFCHPGIHDVGSICFQSYSCTFHIHMCAVTHVYLWCGQWIASLSCTRVCVYSECVCVVQYVQRGSACLSGTPAWKPHVKWHLFLDIYSKWCCVYTV